MEERSSNAWYFQPETWPQREFWGQSVPSWPEIPNGGILGTYPQSNDVWDRSGSEGPRPATPSGMNGGILGMLTQAATERSFNPGAMINIPFGRNMPMSLALSVPRHGDYSSSFSPAQFQYENGSELTPAVRKKADQAECDHMHQQDLFHCRMVGLPEWEANPAAQLLKHVWSLYWASTFLRFRPRSAVTPGYPPARTFRQFTQTGNSDTMWCRITREV